MLSSWTYDGSQLLLQDLGNNSDFLGMDVTVQALVVPESSPSAS